MENLVKNYPTFPNRLGDADALFPTKQALEGSLGFLTRLEKH
jgi:hypothetical protein